MFHNIEPKWASAYFSAPGLVILMSSLNPKGEMRPWKNPAQHRITSQVSSSIGVWLFGSMLQAKVFWKKIQLLKHISFKNNSRTPNNNLKVRIENNADTPSTQKGYEYLVSELGISTWYQYLVSVPGISTWYQYLVSVPVACTINV